MSYDPNATVTIDGVDFTGETLGGLAIHYGRPSIWQQARSSYATISILNLNDTDYAFQINDDVVIEIEDSNAADVTVFTGKVTDISNEVAASGTGATVAIQTLTAVGPFAQMARTIVGTVNYPKEYDDVRISRILTEAGVSVDVVDTPGVYELEARPSDPQDAYTLATYYAQMTFGYMYETKTGSVGYANESRRTVDVEANGYLDIDEGYINWRGINSRKSISDIVNKIILFYKNGQDVTSDDAASIANFGLIEARIDTELEDSDQAQNIADRYVSLRSIPETNFSSFSINLDNPNVTAGDLDDLINIEMGTAVQISDLPNAISPINYTGFVEGWDLVINQSQALLTLTTSDSSYSIVPIRWQDVDPTTEWDDLDPTALKTTRTNLILNPSFETGGTGWTVFRYTAAVYTADFKFGSQSVELTKTSSLSGSYLITRNATYSIPAVQGETFTAFAWFKRTSGTYNNRLAATLRNAPNGTSLETFVSNSENCADWTKISLTFTVTAATATNLEIGLQDASAPLGTTFLVDGVCVVKESSNDYYWDGTTTDIPSSRRPENLAWTGTANNSTSTAEAYFGTIPTLTWANVDAVGLP